MPGFSRRSRAFPLAVLFLAGLFSSLLAGCGGGGSSSSSVVPLGPPAPAKKGKYFTHIVILIQENRTFDNLFATYPGADGATRGKDARRQKPAAAKGRSREPDLSQQRLFVLEA